MKSNTEKTEKYLWFKYKFNFAEKASREFLVHLDRQTLDLVLEKREVIPDWALLHNDRCINCTLDEKKNKYCPVAVNILDLIEFFKDGVSYEEVEITVLTETRSYFKKTTLQKGISSLLGIYMSTSGCPILNRLKPMVRFHLPFASPEETTFRALSSYLLGQHFKHKKGKPGDWDLNFLSRTYEEIHLVNKSFCQRLINANIKDASINAIIILDNFTKFVLAEIDFNLIEEIENLFTV